MTIGYVAAGGVLLAVAGQQSAGDLIDAAMNGDPNAVGKVIDTAQTVVGTGMNLGQAAVLIAFVPLANKVLAIAQPFFQTINDSWRHRLGLGPPPPKV